MNENFDEGRFRNKAARFKDPVALPPDEATARLWQDANRSWWERTPMRYDWREPIGAEAETKEYFDQVDQRFFEATRHFLPWRETPFDTLIPFEALDRMDVLEIGVGQGTHAQLLATHAKSFTGIDLTNAACNATTRRLELAGVAATIRQMDAESMSFPAGSFDFIWSWGVIHHSANTESVLREMHRVLRPGGTATVMVYYRSPVQYYLFNGIARGLIRREFWSIGDIHKINQAATDGALARFFSPREFATLAQGLFDIDRMWVTGQKPEAIPLPFGRLKSMLVDRVPDSATRFLTDNLRLGSFLIARMTRK